MGLLDEFLDDDEKKAFDEARYEIEKREASEDLNRLVLLGRIGREPRLEYPTISGRPVIGVGP